MPLPVSSLLQTHAVTKMTSMETQEEYLTDIDGFQFFLSLDCSLYVHFDLFY